MSASNDEILEAVQALALLTAKQGEKIDRLEDRLVDTRREVREGFTEARERDERARRLLDVLTDAIADLRRDFDRHTHSS